jgi:hypothetical protein
LAGFGGVLGVLGVVVGGCSSPDPTNVKPTTPTGDERDTEITHEACDFSSPQATRVDVNSDKRPDIIHVMTNGRETCRVLDLNFDGSVDAYIFYDAAGLERRREADYDRDGRADEITFLANGAVVRKERETNFDDKIDTWDYYAGGRLVRRERDSDGDAIIDQWWEFNNPGDPRCAIVSADRNADRKPDPDSIVDLCAEAYGAPAAYPPPAAPGAQQPPPGAWPQQPQPGAWPQQQPPPGAWPQQQQPPPGAWPQQQQPPPGAWPQQQPPPGAWPQQQPQPRPGAWPQQQQPPPGAWPQQQPQPPAPGGR